MRVIIGQILNGFCLGDKPQLHPFWWPGCSVMAVKSTQFRQFFQTYGKLRIWRRWPIRVLGGALR